MPIAFAMGMRLSMRKKTNTIQSALSFLGANGLIFLLSLAILVFILFPVVGVLLRSVQLDGSFTTQFYRELINTDMLKITTQSILLAFASSIIAAVFAYLIALDLYLSKEWVRKVMDKVLLVTIISPPFVTSIAMIVLLGRRGLISHGLLQMEWDIYGWQGILIIQILSRLSLGIMMLNNSFESIEGDELAASLDLGAGAIATIKNVVLPSTLPGFLSILFLFFTMNLADFSTPIIIGGRFQTLATESYKAVMATGDLNRGAAMSTVMVIPSIFAFYFYMKSMRQFDESSAKSASGRDYLPTVPKVFKVILSVFTSLFILFNLAKYSTIILSAFTNQATGSLTFTLNNFSKLEGLSIKAFKRSIVFSFIASTIAVIIGTSLSYYIYRAKKRLKPLEFIASLPYIIPGTFFGLGYLVAFNKPPKAITGTAAIVILNLAFRQISISNKTANAVYVKIDQKIESAAKDLGASRFTMLRTIILPMSAPIFASSFAQIFTSSMTAFGSIMFLVSPGKLLASTEMFRQIKGGGNSVGSILAILIILATATVNISMTLLFRRLDKVKGQ